MFAPLQSIRRDSFTLGEPAVNVWRIKASAG